MACENLARSSVTLVMRLGSANPERDRQGLGLDTGWLGAGCNWCASRVFGNIVLAPVISWRQLRWILAYRLFSSRFCSLLFWR